MEINADFYFRWSMAILNKVKIRYPPKNHLYSIPSLFTPIFFTLPIYTNILYPPYLHQYSLPFQFTEIFLPFLFTEIFLPFLFTEIFLPFLFTAIISIVHVPLIYLSTCWFQNISVTFFHHCLVQVEQQDHRNY